MLKPPEHPDQDTSKQPLEALISLYERDLKQFQELEIFYRESLKFQTTLRKTHPRFLSPRNLTEQLSLLRIALEEVRKELCITEQLIREEQHKRDRMPFKENIHKPASAPNTQDEPTRAAIFQDLLQSRDKINQQLQRAETTGQYFIDPWNRLSQQIRANNTPTISSDCA